MHEQWMLKTGGTLLGHEGPAHIVCIALGHGHGVAGSVVRRATWGVCRGGERVAAASRLVGVLPQSPPPRSLLMLGLPQTPTCAVCSVCTGPVCCCFSQGSLAARAARGAQRARTAAGGGGMWDKVWSGQRAAVYVCSRQVYASIGQLAREGLFHVWRCCAALGRLLV